MSTLDAHFHGRHGAFSLDAAFTLPMHGVSALFGPSGCGKTTTVNAIAGLMRPDQGRILLQGRDLRVLPRLRQ